MRNFFYLCLVLMVALIACNSDTTKSDTTTDENTVTNIEEVITKATTTDKKTTTDKSSTTNPDTEVKNTDNRPQAEIDAEKITNYAKEKGLTTKTTESGIHYIVETEGEGNNPDINSFVTVHYKGTLLDGSTFDSSYDRGEPITFPLKNVVKGWQEGIPLFKKGGKGSLIIPSALAYGPNARPGIPANSILRFDIELKEVATKEEMEKKDKDAASAQNTIDEDLIKKYIKEKGLTAKKTPDGIYYVIEKEGEGSNPTVQSTVEVHYKGTLLDGSTFDSSYDRGEAATFLLARVVPGWQKGIPLFKKGGKGTLLIPSSLAYGKRGAGAKIPANSVLRFDIELIDIK